MKPHDSVNEAGLTLIKLAEGLRLKAYRDVAGILTIGYGHTGSDVRPQSIITEKDAEALLNDDLEDVVDGVNRALRVMVTANQFSALCSLAYNIGLGNFNKSTLLKRLNAGDYKGAAEQFLAWKYVNKVAVAGLEARRKAEKALFEQ